MTRNRVKLIAAALTLVLVIAIGIATFTVRRSGVHAYSMDPRLRIYDVHYFRGTNDYDFSYAKPGTEQIKYQCQRLLNAVGIKSTPWVQVNPFRVRGKSPALVICGGIEGAKMMSPFVLLTGDGKDVNPIKVTSHRIDEKNFPPYDGTDNRFTWFYALYNKNDRSVEYQLTNGTYHLRYDDETNDLAIIRIR